MVKIKVINLFITFSKKVPSQLRFTGKISDSTTPLEPVVPRRHDESSAKDGCSRAARFLFVSRAIQRRRRGRVRSEAPIDADQLPRQLGIPIRFHVRPG